MWISKRVIPAEGAAAQRPWGGKKLGVSDPQGNCWDWMELSKTERDRNTGPGGRTETRRPQVSHSPFKMSLQSRNCSHPDFTDEETGTESLRNLSRATQVAEHGCEPGSSSILGLYHGV